MSSGTPTKSAILRSAAVTAATSTAALLLAARLERRPTLLPLNATSHWLHGDRAALRPGFSLSRTGIGLATNLGACLFWAVFHESWRARRPPLGSTANLAAATATAAIAAYVDYRATPPRFTPGWDLALSRQGMGLAYAGFALGFALVHRPAPAPRRIARHS